jgi:predicted nucleotide-binding protein
MSLALFGCFWYILRDAQFVAKARSDEKLPSEERSYRRTRFSVDVIREAVKVFDQQINPDENLKPVLDMYVYVSEDLRREYVNEEEFFADYITASDSAHYQRKFRVKNREKGLLRVLSTPAAPAAPDKNVRVSIKVAATEPSQIKAVLNVFEANKEKSLLPMEKPKKKEPVVFIGHGHSEDWKQLRDHLRDKHGFEVEAYEARPRAGHTMENVLATMLAKATIAFLVMTGEDETVTGSMNPRLNVVHELGLFQGKLGFEKAIVLLKHGAAEFSNIEGLQQIRFTDIEKVFGEVVAIINQQSRNN